MKTEFEQRLIGVLGGMGPAATIDFMARITANTTAVVDQEHVPMLVHSVPQIPDRSRAILMGNDGPYAPLRRGVDVLVAAGVSCIAMPCNTAHFWHERLSVGTPVPILHIANAVLSLLGAQGGSPGAVAIMATRGTIHADIYGTRLRRAGATVLLPDEATQQSVDVAIAHVKAGQVAAARIAIQTAAANLLAAGAERLLLACTELPVAMAGMPYQSLSIDCTDALARACVAASRVQSRIVPQTSIPAVFAASMSDPALCATL